MMNRQHIASLVCRAPTADRAAQPSYSLTTRTLPGGAAWMQSSQSTHSSRFSSTMRSAPSVFCAKMFTGHTSVSFFASAGSAAACASTWTSMNMPGISVSCLCEALLDQSGDLLDALRHGDAGDLHALDLVGRRIGLALDDRARVPESHAGHLVH